MNLTGSRLLTNVNPNELIAGGLDPYTPSAVIQQGTVVGQRLVKSPLCEIAQEVKRLRLASPSIVLIGSTINYQVEDCSPLPADVTMPIPF